MVIAVSAATYWAIWERGSDLSGSAFPKRFSRGAALIVVKAKGVDEEVRGRLSGHGFSTEASFLICGTFRERR
jgi:hypothetical protein